MRPIPIFLPFLISLVPVFAGLKVAAQEGSLEATLDAMVSDGRLVAAQAVVGRRDGILVDHVVGVATPGGKQKVNSDTLFCIGSCSKPFASAIIMSLVEDKTLDLERPIDKYIPAFGALKLRNGKSARRAPTMKELLTHRGGVYSQKKGMTRSQAGWIRDFRLTLEESTQGIAGEPLISEPGTEYAYSGAGYCVAGRVAEVVTGKSIEQLLRSRIAVPLGLERTTYFPDANDRNVAAGGSNDVANPATPHLAKPELRFALVGGSLYSTAQETARLLRMLAQRGRLDNNTVLSRDSWKTWVSRPYAEGPYGFGWFHIGAPSGSRPTGLPTALNHAGSLASSRSNIMVVLKTGSYAAVHYTVGSRDDGVHQAIKNAVARTIKNGNDR